MPRSDSSRAEGLVMKIGDREFDVEVKADKNGSDVWFTAEHDGRPYVTRDWGELRKTLRRQMRKATVDVSVPFVAIRRDGIVKGVATGIHGGTGNVLVRWASGETEQLTDMLGQTFYELTPDEVDRLRQLVDARREADNALHLFAATRKTGNLLNVVRRTLEELTEDSP